LSIDPSGADGAVDRPVDPTQEIGRRVANRRAQLGKKASDLAREAHVSASLISQIERGQSKPSVSTLFAIAEALDLPVDAFFKDGGEGYPTDPEKRVPLTGKTESRSAADTCRPNGPRHRYLVRSGERATIDIEDGVRWERLTPQTLADAEILELVYSAGAESHPTLYSHPGSEIVLVLSGSLNIVLGFDRFELMPGDSMHFPSSLPHKYVNPTGHPTRAVTVILHDAKCHTPSANGERLSG
jgi:transcriptional regulator with XRE-family HTH domain/quercetin dioxygenase-like cupin family protein